MWASDEGSRGCNFVVSVQSWVSIKAGKGARITDLIIRSALKYTWSSQQVDEDWHNPLEELRIDLTGRVVVQAVA